MTANNPSIAEQIGHAARAFEQVRTGHVPKSVTVILKEDTLVITLRGVLTRAERVLANTEEGAAWVREYHRRLLMSSSSSLLDEVKRITGLSACESTVTEGDAVPLFEIGAIVHVFVLSAPAHFDVWSGSDVEARA
jgi:uncharacterized protein YbcI